MVINELFYSLQGEGKLAGVVSLFIRLAGCPLRCRWCDTAYARLPSAGTPLNPEWLAEQINRYFPHHIVITGGEPMTHPDLPELIALVRKQKAHLTIETAGVQYIADLPCELMSISPKLQNSIPADPAQTAIHDSLRLNPSIIRRLMDSYPYQLKFVVDTRADLDEIARLVGQLGQIRPQDVFLMPQATDRQQYIEKSIWLADYCLKTGFSFSPRLHVMLWPGQRGK